MKNKIINIIYFICAILYIILFFYFDVFKITNRTEFILLLNLIIGLITFSLLIYRYAKK